MKMYKHLLICFIAISSKLYAQVIEAKNPSTDASIYSVLGVIIPTSPGGFSAGIRGINNGTGGLGIGVWGSQNGSGWGVYGVTPSGIGVYGNSSSNGYGLYGNSNTGVGLNATSINGVAANFSIYNNANNNNVIEANTVGNGTVINVSTSGSGTGIRSSTSSGFSIQGITTAITSAGIVGDNNGGGEAVVGRTTSDIAGSVVGRNDGGGYGVRGFVATSTSGEGIGVYGQIGISGSKGRAGRFENFNSSNDYNTFEVVTNSLGNNSYNTLGNAASFTVNNSNSVSAAVRGEVNTIFGNFGAAGVFGTAIGTGGVAGLFYASNASGSGKGLVAITEGQGNAITANVAKDGNGVESYIDGAGNAVYGWVPTYSNGKAGRFEIFNQSNTNDVVSVKTVGNGTALRATVNRTTGTSAALKGEINSQFANFGTAAVYGESSGTGGVAGLFYSSNSSGSGNAISSYTDGSGNAIYSLASGSGYSFYGLAGSSSTKVARFENTYTSNANITVQVLNAGTGTAFFVNHTGSSGNIGVFQSNSSNVARINKSGTGYFNGGTVSSGADVAEAFDVDTDIKDFEPGDVLVIAVDKDRTVAKSAEPYSNLVAGVYATKPGVLLTEENIDTELTGKVPMGVVGVIPTKVCLEGGAIKRGDMLVTSSIPGVAMKANRKKVEVGQVIGKALQEFNSENISTIKVLVSIK